MSDVYKATIEAEIVLKPIVSSTRYVESPEVTGPARAAMPLPQTATPANQGRVGHPASSGGQQWLMSALLAILIIVSLANLTYVYRYDIARWWYSGSSYWDSLKKGDRMATEVPDYRPAPAVAPQQPAEAPQPVRVGNPTKEKYLADCKAAGAPVVQLPDGRLNCKVASTVTFERGTPIASLQAAKTVAQYKAACEAIRGANYWMEENGRPHCNRPD